MAALRDTIDAMKDALQYIDTYGPEEDGEWTGEEMAYPTYVKLKKAIRKEESRIARDKAMRRNRKFEKTNPEYFDGLFNHLHEASHEV